jgi:MOSC domain-containing protein YiiM
VFARLVITISARSGSATKGAKGHRTDRTYGTHGDLCLPTHKSHWSHRSPPSVVYACVHPARAEIFGPPALRVFCHHALHTIATPAQQAYRFLVPDFEITHLYISPGHNFFGHERDQPSSNPALEVPSIWCVAGKGIEGDRFFDYKESYKGQITFFEEETFADLCAQLGIWDRPPSVFRRNVLTRGVRLNDLIGHEFTIGDVHLLGTEESRPCFWMDHAFGPGAQAALKGRGGLRARILTTGRLAVTSPSRARVLVEGR